MAKDNPPTSLWFIFQGDTAKAHVEELRRATAKMEGIAFHLSSDAPLPHQPPPAAPQQGHPFQAGTILTEVINDSRACAGAVAVVAPTGVDASVRGNLWLEIGLWLAQRDMHLLKICHFGEIFPISDINNLPYEPYSNIDQLKAIVTRHASYVRQHSQAQPTPDTDPAYRKVHETFTSSAATDGSPWLNAKSYFCHRRFDEEEECPFRKKSLEFAAELLRMGRANHERNTFENCLSRIAYACRNLYFAGSPGRSREGITARESGLRILDREIKRLLKLINQLLGGQGRDEAYAPGAILPAKERFARFLRARLDVAKRLELDDLQIELNQPISALKAAADRLLEKLEYLAEGNQEYRFNGQQKDSAYPNDLWLWGDYCHGIATYLQLVGLAYFDDCSRVLMEHLGNSRAPYFYHELEKAIDELPHNQRNPSHMRIWQSPVVLSTPQEEGK